MWIRKYVTLKFYLLGYNAMQFIEIQPMFWRNKQSNFQWTTLHYTPEDRTPNPTC
jgi:hypothetical protein